VARTQLAELVAEFPENPLFATELAKLNVPPAAAYPPKEWTLPEQNVPEPFYSGSWISVSARTGSAGLQARV
jgi:hypothetical protein